MRTASTRKAWVSAACLTLAVLLGGLGVAGCSYGNNYGNGVGCGLANTIPAGPAPAPGSEFVFVPNALCAPGVANDVMSVLVLNGTTFSNGPVPLVQTGNEPVWATVDPTNHFVYVTNFADNTVSAFTLNTATGQIAVVPGSPFLAGIGPAAAAVDPSGMFLYVANDGTSTGGGSISGYKINANGSLTQVPGSPFTTNPALTPQQGIAVTAGFVYVSNVASNNVSAFSFDNTGKLTQLATSPFTLAPALTPEPESLAVDPAGNLLFTANTNSDNVSAFTIKGDGSLTQDAGSPFSPGFSSPQYLTTDQTGKFLYASNVGNNTVTAYTTAGAQLGTALATGNGPQGLTVDAANNVVMVANCNDGDLSVYEINGDGSLKTLGVTADAIIACPQMVATTHP